MTEILPNLFIGTINDYEIEKNNEDFYTVIAAKEPYHRLVIGYSGRSCGKDHPEYLYAERERLLVCNLVDVDNPDWISPVIINKAIEYIENVLKNLDRQVIVCCNQGHSRSAVIGLLYMRYAGVFEGKNFEEAEKLYQMIYPDYSPANGMREYARTHWNDFR